MTGLVQTSSEATGRVLILVPSDCYSGLLQPSDLISLPDGRSTACPIRMSLYIFLINNIYYLYCLCFDFDDLSAWCGCWFVVSIRSFIYKFLNVCPFDYTAVAGSGKVGPVNRLTTSIEWMLSVAIWLTVLSRYRNCRVIGHFSFQIHLNLHAWYFPLF